MFRTYLISALRQLKRKKTYTAIAGSTLFLGILTASVISVFIAGEYSYDSVHTEKDRIFRLGIKQKDRGKIRSFALSAPEMGTTLKDSFPEIRYCARLLGYNSVFKSRTRKFKKSFFFTDSSLFNMFYPECD